MKIAIASDHGGYLLKEIIKSHLSDRDIEYKDLGPKESIYSVDYPSYAHIVSDLVIKEKFDRGILICGTGIGMSIVANRYKGIRASVVNDVFSAKATREHNDSNILCLGQRVIGDGLALMIVDTWLDSTFLKGRHKKRVDLIEDIVL